MGGGWVGGVECIPVTRVSDFISVGDFTSALPVHSLYFFFYLDIFPLDFSFFIILDFLCFFFHLDIFPLDFSFFIILVFLCLQLVQCAEPSAGPLPFPEYKLGQMRRGRDDDDHHLDGDGGHVDD